MEERFLGTWRLVSWTRDKSAQGGGVAFPMGERPLGFISYQPDGRMFVEVMNPDRPRAASDELGMLTQAEKIRAADTFLAYCGSYSVTEQTVVHHVELSLFPNWVGTDLERTYRFLDGGNRLELTALIDGHTDHLLWERLAPPPK